MGAHLALWSLCIADRNAAAFLSPVLQGKKPIIDSRRHIVPIQVIDSKNPALLAQFICPNTVP